MWVRIWNRLIYYSKLQIKTNLGDANACTTQSSKHEDPELKPWFNNERKHHHKRCFKVSELELKKWRILTVDISVKPENTKGKTKYWGVPWLSLNWETRDGQRRTAVGCTGAMFRSSTHIATMAYTNPCILLGFCAVLLDSTGIDCTEYT